MWNKQIFIYSFVLLGLYIHMMPSAQRKKFKWWKMEKNRFWEISTLKSFKSKILNKKKSENAATVLLSKQHTLLHTQHLYFFLWTEYFSENKFFLSHVGFEPTLSFWQTPRPLGHKNKNDQKCKLRYLFAKQTWNSDSPWSSALYKISKKHFGKLAIIPWDLVTVASRPRVGPKSS